jgi:glycosyltransferase involved in cell wall biosynthesis
MKISLSAHRPFHFAQLANALVPLAESVHLYTSAPRRYFSGMDASIQLHFIPSPILIASYLFPKLIPETLLKLDTPLYDRNIAARMATSDVFFGLATRCLLTAEQAKRRGARFVLDRACPHVHIQQALIQREAGRVEFRLRPQPQWLVNRQLEEYDLADAILVPSQYTRTSFPAELQSRLVLAPLLGRLPHPTAPRPAPNAVFTVGVVGNSPLRKGYLYLLRAWKRLALPNAQLLMRCGDNLSRYPALQRLLKELPNVKLLPYFADMAEFYRTCDVFVLPSVDDGFGMALLEAIACGTPSIATSACGASELLSDGTECLIVPPASEDALAKAILRLYHSQALRETIGQSGEAASQRIAESKHYESAIAALIARLAATG